MSAPFPPLFASAQAHTQIKAEGKCPLVASLVKTGGKREAEQINGISSKGFASLSTSTRLITDKKPLLLFGLMLLTEPSVLPQLIRQKVLKMTHTQPSTCFSSPLKVSCLSPPLRCTLVGQRCFKHFWDISALMTKTPTKPPPQFSSFNKKVHFFATTELVVFFHRALITSVLIAPVLLL